MNSKGDKLLVAAIDFGTTYSGYAYVFKHEDFSRMKINNLWNGGSLMSLKCPTCVLFDENKQFHSFGYEAEDKYSELANDDKHEKWYYFRRFKMLLHKKGADIDSGSLTIALEPEAASLICQLLPSDIMFSGSGRLTANKYMILDLGGGTADITVHEKQADGSLRELHEPTGGAWDGTKVDEAFHQMLIKIVGAKTFKTFCDTQKFDHLDLLRELEMKKRTITHVSDNKIVVNMPFSLTSLYQQECGETIADAINETPFKDKIIWAAGKVRIEANVFKGLFKECTDGVTRCVRELLQEPEVKDVDTFFMVGGFSESPMMQAAIRDALPNAKIIIPADVGLVVLKGAVVFGREPMKIASRIAKYTYGISISPPFDSTLHPQEKRVVVGGKERCKDVFKKYIQKGESIKIGERRSGKHVSLKADQKKMLLRIYASAEKDPKFITDPGCEYMGRLIVKLPEAQDIFKVKVDMMFETEFLVDAEEETSKQKITSYFDFL
ncbi:hypothetical protein ACJMK2_031006 [Sinanodonta woodiana]|uniref:Uncharacterized protein n=1 Tax=Sinanodonta woodiana TaxID=1069815 RepID=A0ABD3WXI6_SINWO